jgi:uncharacterized protein (TIGR02145 family)
MNEKQTSKINVMKKNILHIIAVTVCLQLTSLPVSSVSYYVSPTGNDSNSGTIGAPWRTFQKALTRTAPGDTVYFRGGTYTMTSSSGIDFSGSNSGTEANPISYYNYPGETPIFDFNYATPNVTNPMGMSISGISYINLKGFEIRNVVATAAGGIAYGINVKGNNINFERISVLNVFGIGYSLEGNNLFFNNCDAYFCYDLYSADPGSGGDGWQIVSNGNDYLTTFTGCRAAFCSDNGWNCDLNDGVVRWDRCWAISSGKNTDGIHYSSSSEGNGFNLGHNTVAASGKTQRLLRNCIAADNYGIGITENNAGYPQIKMEIYNCVSYSNAYGFVNYITSTALQQATYRNNIAYNNTTSDTQWNDATKLIHDHNTWNPEPPVVTDADFVSLVTEQLSLYSLTRKLDGSLPDVTFMNLVSGSDLIDAGINVGLPYLGIAPDLGWIEYSGSAPIIPVYLGSVIENAYPSRLDISYDLNFANIIPAPSAFTVRVNSISRSVNSVVISDNKVQLSLASPVVYGDIVTVAYTKPATNPLQTPSGGQAASFTDQNVSNNVAQIPDSVTDVEDNTYSTIQIGTQTWMAENLKTTKYNDGNAIPNITDNTSWDALTSPAYAWYDNNIANKVTYGALYNWYAVETGKLCPVGWHVPTDAQLTQLTNYVGGESVAGGKLKEMGTTHWISPNEGATDEYGFAALPGGDRLLNGVFYSIGAIGSWWSSTDTLSIYAWHRFVWNNEIRFSRIYDSKTNGISVRCIKDNIDPTIVTNVNDNGIGSLRNSLEYSNSTIGVKETITFNIPGTGPFPIQPLTELPRITDPVIINGYSQPGSIPASSSDTARILIRIYGTSAGSDATGLNVTADGCSITGLYISNFRFGIYLNQHGNNIVKGNVINANRSCGILIYSSDNEIGGITPASRNIIINNNVGIQLDNEAVGGSPGWGRNKIIGNYIGVDPTGTKPFGNTTGIVNVDSPDNIIGGTAKEERNIISSNGTGIRFDYFREDAVRNKILGNYIGTNAGGSEALGNTYSGISMSSPDNFIGDVPDGSGNLISGNGTGIHLGKRAIGNMIKGNKIGTDFSGYKAISNTVRGIEIRDGKNNQIGGLLSGEGNLISGNSNEGILILGEFDMGPNPADGNIVKGNYIGTDRSGLKPLGNGTGIRIGEDANNNMIGGMESGAGNIIAFNNNCGIVIADPDDPGTGNKILSNSIHSNGGLGIDLGDNGVTLSNPDTDPLDSDTGPNNLQNFPVIDSLNYTSSSVYIRGRLNSAANSGYTLEFFANKVADNTGYGEGRTYLGSKTVTTNSSGNATFSETFSRSTGWGDVITATATDAQGNTSEFSEAVGGLRDQIIAPANWPFHFRVNEDGILRITNGSDLTAVRQSFATWENITTANIDFVDDGTTTLRNASATDGINLVSFTDEKFPFPPRVLAIAAKTLQVSPNDDVARIIDADIVVNPEFSALSVGVGNGNYYDAQSIITHEIGHVMGLLHTGVVNSTMFFMLGYGTKVQSLEQDDRSWASYKYPGASYNSTFGSISGHISYGYGGYPVAGTHVMAIRTGVANPDTIHSYSDADGNYLVPGLPAGTYNIYIQPLDGNVNGFNLRPGNISTYIYCNTIYTDYPGEFLSTNESATETTDPPLSLSVSAGSNFIAGEITTNRDITSPTLLQVRPTDPDGAKIKVLSNFIIKFSEPVNESTLTGQTCYLELETTSGPKQFGGTFYTLPDSLNIIVFNPDSILRFSKIYSLHLTGGIQDMKGNGLTVPAPVSFTTVDRDLVPPTIKGTYPSSTAENVLVASNVKVMFSEPMSTESLADNFALTWVGGTPAITNKVEGSITWDAEKATLTFTPSQSLGEATNYTITVSTGATDLSANHLTTVNNFTFSTVNVAAPVVKYLGPTNSQTGVTIETPVVADFSEAIDPLSVTNSTFSLRLSGSQASVTGDFEFLNGNARVVFKPASNLSPGTVYLATLTTGIKDVSPTVSMLAANVTSTFTTAPTPAAPTITFLDPPRGTVKVGTATAVTISGTGFDPSPSKNLILFNGITAFAKTATLNTLTTEVPVGTMSGPVTVTVNGRTSNQMQFDIIPDYMNDPDYTTSNKSLPSGSSGGSSVSGSGEAVFAMVTNPENNSVTRIGLGTSGTTTTIPVGGLYPVKVDIDQLGKYAYVTNYYSHDVSVINLATNQVFKIIPAGVGPYGVAVTSDGKRVYVSNYESGNLSLIDVDPTSGGFDHVVANVSTGSNPGNIAVTADAGMVLVTGPFGLKIVDSNPKSVDYNSVTATVSSGTKTTDVTVTADAGFAIVATEEGSLLIVNLHPANDDYSGAVVASVPTGTKVSDVKASGDALYVYAIDTENDQILVYKFSGGATGIPSGSGTQGITLIPLDPIPVPDAPSGLNISPAGDKIYTITSLTSSNRQVTTISLTGGIISPEQSIQGLISTIQIMIDNGNIPRVRGAALIVTLNSALRNVAAGRTKLAILDLNVFVALVNTYIKNKQVSNTQGKALIDVANVIINQLKGTKSGGEEFSYTDVEQPVPEPVAQTKLGVIYPNPSMDAITIEYEIAENEPNSGKVSVQVYDVTGRVVGNLVNETMKPGRYSATWSGCYENGSSVPRGIYFIRFSAGNVREVKQIMLIR